MNIAVIQDPTTLATALVEEVTLANFHTVVFRVAEAGATISEENGVYVQTSADGQSRRMLFPVKA